MNKRELSLKEVQQIELEILEYLHDICEKHNLIYFLDYGTLLGAVRHQGFIPWDDDTDISLSRADYEKLYEILKKENHKYYKIISSETDKTYPYTYFRVYDNRTYRDSNLRNKEIQLGTCVDVFPYDGFITDENDKKRINLYNKFRILSSYSYEGVKKEGASFLNNFIRILSASIFRFTSVEKWNKKINLLAKKYENKIGGFSDVSIFHSQDKPGIKTEWIYDTIYMEYEGKSFRVPKNYKDFLVYEFGENYMTPLPPSEITNGKDKNYIVE